MRAFAQLYHALDTSNKTNDKVAAMADYFRAAPPADAAWAVYFLSGRKPRQIVPARRLAEWATETAGVPLWLFGESYDAVADLAETITLILPNAGGGSDLPLHVWVEERLLPLRKADEAHQHDEVVCAWRELDALQRFLYNKLITGAFRVGVSQLLVVRALAQVSGAKSEAISHRLMGTWEPTPAFFSGLVALETADADASRPYPFYLAHPVDEARLEDLGDVRGWQIEWKWDGIRAQLIRRQGAVYLWSRGDELVTPQYPEIEAMGAQLPDGTVIDGELLPWVNGRVMPFAQLQRRLGRKTLGKKLLEEVPVVLVAYDLLEQDAEDIRRLPLEERRARLEAVVAAVANPHLLLSPTAVGESWTALAELRGESRARGVEGFMIKRRASAYGVGRVRGDWWKWKIDPYTVDAVLINAQRGNGKRASLYTDYTFGVWDDEGHLIPFAKAYSGLTDAEIREVDSFVRRNTLERFGPVRSVKPELVFELAFEAIQPSNRHKSGIAVRFPRIARWRRDKTPADADSLATLRTMLGIHRGEET